MSSLLTRELVHQLLADHNALNGEKNKKEKCNRKKKIYHRKWGLQGVWKDYHEAKRFVSHEDKEREKETRRQENENAMSDRVRDNN